MEVYQLHVWLCEIPPLIWRRLLVRSDSTIADLHHTLQFVMVSENGGDWVGKTERGQGTKLMVLAQGRGTPLGVCVEQAAPPAVRLRERPLDSGNAGAPNAAG